MLKKIATFLLLSTSLTMSQHSVANLIYPGKVSDFNNGNLDGWSKGPRSSAQPQIKTNTQGHHYLQVSSTRELTFPGERDPDSRLKVLNHTHWLSDYNLLGIIGLKVRMANLGKDPIHMRFFFGNTTHKKMCITATVVQLPPDKQWQEIVFNMEQPELICGTTTNSDRVIQPAPFSIAELKKNLNNIFFMSLESPEADGKIVGTLGIDSIEALTSASLNFVANTTNSKQPATIDLHTDVAPNSELIQHINNTPELTNIGGTPTRYQVLANTGVQQIHRSGRIEALR